MLLKLSKEEINIIKSELSYNIDKYDEIPRFKILKEIIERIDNLLFAEENGITEV